MTLERPNLENIDPKIQSYIEYLEAEIDRLRSGSQPRRTHAEVIEPSEPPTTQNLITISAKGKIKRTPRHLYSRQRRGGMGIFDLQTSDIDQPSHILIADENQDLLLITDQARGYRLPVSKIHQSAVHDRGQDLEALISLPSNEHLTIVLPAQEKGALALLSQRGYVRLLRHNYVNATMHPGVPLFDTGRFGPLACGNWTTGNDDIFIATRQGQAIRFREKMVHTNGSLGIRVERGDAVVAITGVNEEGGVFLLGQDGKGTIRLMSGFRSNKSPGAGGKIAMKTDHLVSAQKVTTDDDIFIISKLCKMIRFRASEIPPKEGVVQGVHCIALRADQAVSAVISRMISPEE